MRRLALALVLAALLPACAEAPPPPATVPVAPALPAPPPPPASSTPESRAAPKEAGPARPAGVPGTSIRFTGGDGSSFEQAILIEGAKGEVDGVASEYTYLQLLLGPPKVAWTLGKQSLLEHNGRRYDLMEVIHQGKPEAYYFDITLYFGKM